MIESLREKNNSKNARNKAQYEKQKAILIEKINQGKIKTIPESIIKGYKKFIDDEDVWYELIKKHNTERFLPARFQAELLPDNMIASVKVMLEAVRYYGLNLRYADDSVRDNEVVVLAAVKNDGLALQYASHRLQENENIFIPALEENEDAHKFIHITRENAFELATILTKYSEGDYQVSK